MNTTTPAPANKNGAAPPRMSLTNVRRGKLDVPLRVLLYGVEGVGKSSFASRAPKPIFLGGDAGTENLNIDRLPEPQSWADVLDAIRLLQNERHDYETFVADPLSFLEAMCWDMLCKKNGWKTMDDLDYGKCYQAAVDEWRVFLLEIEKLWLTKRMHIVLTDHSKVKLFKNPLGDDFERYVMAMHEKSASILKKWCAGVFFAKHDVAIYKDSKTKRVRGLSDGSRVMHTQWSAAFDAKNRWDLPPEMPLSWDEFVSSVGAHREREVALRKQIADGVAVIGDPEVTKKVATYLEAAGDDVTKLAEIANAVAMKLGEKTQTAQGAEKKEQ